MCSLCRLWVNFDFFLGGGSLCRLPVAENHNFGQIFTFGSSCTDPLLPMKVKFGALLQTERLHLRAKFNLNVFIVSPSGGQKPQFWANFEFFLGGMAPVPAPFYRLVSNLVS